MGMLHNKHKTAVAYNDQYLFLALRSANQPCRLGSAGVVRGWLKAIGQIHSGPAAPQATFSMADLQEAMSCH